MAKLRVFLSYPSEAHEEVGRVYEALRIAGFDPWMDQHRLEVGDHWNNEITSSLHTSDALIICLSSRAPSSEERYFIQEYRLGLKIMGARPADESHILPVQLDACGLPPDLLGFQTIDLGREHAMDRLEAALRKIALRLQRDIEPLAIWHLNRAVDLLRRGQVNAALVEAGKAIDIAPDDPMARICRARGYLAQDQFLRALADLDVAGEAGGRDTEEMRAQALAGIGQLEEATKIVTRVLGDSPNSVTSLLVRAKVYEKKRYFRLALKDYERVVELAPGLSAGHAGIGRSLAEFQRDREAIGALSRAVDLEPLNSQWLYMRARAAGAAAQFAGLEGGFAQAMNDLTAAIALSPGEGVYYAERGWLHWKMGDLESALRDMEAAAKTSPRDGRVFFTTGIFMQEAGRPKEGMAALDRAVALDPSDAENFAARGTLRAANKLFDQAIDDFNRAISLVPENRSFYQLRGDCYQATDRMKEALDDYQRFLGQEPGHDSIADPY